MTPLRVTLCAEGPSDDMLSPIVRWALFQHLPGVPVVNQFAEWFGLPRRPRLLSEKIAASLGLFPCELLVVHRDADATTRAERVGEVREAVAALAAEGRVDPPYVCVVPVRMSEAWLLFDEGAVRSAAGNPNGKVKLSLPAVKSVEGLADPKERLNSLLNKASERTGRRLDKFKTSGRARRVAEYIEDFSPLRHLPAFQAFEEEVRAFTRVWGKG